jgi:hypothetical protein
MEKVNNKINNVVRIPTSLDSKFFKYWLEFLRPFHHLTDREIDVIACFIKHRYLLGKVINDSKILDKIIMNKDTKKQIREECGITRPHFQIIMGKLREKNVIINNTINPKFIPNIESDSGTFKLMLLFDLQ